LSFPKLSYRYIADSTLHVVGLIQRLYYVFCHAFTKKTNCIIYIHIHNFSYFSIGLRTYITSISILNRGSDTNILTPTLKVMREGRVVQSGKYDELLKAGLDFGALLEAHESSMKIAETSDKTGNDSAQSQKLARIPSKEKESGGRKAVFF
jgi:hypothetical protein